MNTFQSRHSTNWRNEVANFVPTRNKRKYVVTNRWTIQLKESYQFGSKWRQSCGAMPFVRIRSSCFHQTVGLHTYILLTKMTAKYLWGFKKLKKKQQPSFVHALRMLRWLSSNWIKIRILFCNMLIIRWFRCLDLIERGPSNTDLIKCS